MTQEHLVHVALPNLVHSSLSHWLRRLLFKKTNNLAEQKLCLFESPPPLISLFGTACSTGQYNLLVSKAGVYHTAHSAKGTVVGSFPFSLNVPLIFKKVVHVSTHEPQVQHQST